MDSAVSGGGGNQADSIIAGIDLSQPFDVTMHVTSATTQNITTGAFAVYIGDITSTFCGFQVDTSIGTAGANNCLVEYFKTDTSEVDTGPFVWARNTTHKIRLHLEAGVATIYVDDVLRSTVADAGISGIVAPYLAIFVLASPTTNEHLNSISGSYFS